ncbi:putative phosphoglycolate phosphatase [Candidatus Terasakiella magnetica]|uniref:Putative phosphoglycolate phosphatase n=1 Tax=Candidatus Terasakiella magnetica TaxID=1867952 RepID=A0A1C3RD89_9PROT|nr:HAD-IA family hydrolase [Candidatus Terasakiella magnetica]SCA55260.1 putative phosphoglycolate phosphatase [Candidatus Terasakiella magnetica]
MSNSPLQLAIFDCDGTLVDSQHSIINAMDLTCSTYGFDKISRDSVRRVVGLPLEIAMEQLFEDQTQSMHHEMAETYRSHFRDMRLAGDVEEPLFDGTIKALDDLEADGWLLGVATGKAMRGLIPTLETHDLQNKFATLQTACRAMGKPHPEMVEKALSETGVEAKNAVVIGDTTYDIHMAGNANVKSIGVSWGYHDAEELMDAGAACIIHDYSELKQAINKVMES